MTQHYRLALAFSFTMAALVASVSLGLWSGLMAHHHLLRRHLLRLRLGSAQPFLAARLSAPGPVSV